MTATEEFQLAAEELADAAGRFLEAERDYSLALLDNDPTLDAYAEDEKTARAVLKRALRDYRRAKEREISERAVCATAAR